MHKIRWLVLGAVTALLVNTGTAAAAPPNFTPAEKLCAAQGGEFHGVGDVLAYECTRLDSPFNDAELRVASALCEGAYKGEFADLSVQDECNRIGF
jgi:hypothetical protein